jgi:uncharacterized protein DUF5916/cellulose/xylan binding protein with CBM9 domain
MRRFFYIPLISLMTAYSGSAQEASSNLVYDGSQGNVEIGTPHRTGDFQISIDGVIDEAIWEDAAVLTGFTQYNPSEGIPSSQNTEVRVFYTDDAIYFAVRAFDDDASGIRATMAQRDQVTRNDDYVRIILDTFNDQRRAYAFVVNPYGVQQDGIWIEGGGGGRGRFGPPIDDNPNFLWDSGGRLYDWGYSVEMKIPFKSVRFPKVPLQSWGLQVNRRIQRTGFQQSWGPSFAREPNKLSESGQLQSLANLNPGLFLQVNPVFTGSKVGTLDATGDFNRTSPEGDFGLNLTYGLTSNLTLDGTINPDFSQVEADAGQIAVNERFALFFPEKRPFFLEGTEIFGLPQNLVFTRTIANPLTGAKLTGKIGGASVGYLGAIDQFENDDDVFANLVRIRQDVGGTSTVGAIYTDRTRSSAEYNRVAGADARFVFKRRYTLNLQAARSWDQDLGERRTSGDLAYVQLQRAGRAFRTQISASDIGSDFRTESGFLRRTGEVNLNLTNTRYQWYGKPGAFLQSYGPGFEFRGYWDHDAFWNGGAIKEAQAQLQWTMSLRNNITIWTTASRTIFDSPVSKYEGLFVNEGGEQRSAFTPDQNLFAGLYSFRLFAFFSGWERVRGRLTLSGGETAIFDVFTGTAVEPANSLGGDVSLTLLPTTSMRIELGVRHSSITRKSSGESYSKATIPRVRAQYQFNRSWFLRGIVEYSRQERGDLLDPATGRRLEFCGVSGCSFRTGSDRNDFSIEGLLSYEPSPGTVVFFGYTRLMRDTGAFRFRNIQTRQDGLFVKLSYLFRK